MTDKERFAELTRLLEQANATHNPMEKARILPLIIPQFFALLKSLYNRVEDQQRTINDLKAELRKLGVLPE